MLQSLSGKKVVIIGSGTSGETALVQQLTEVGATVVIATPEKKAADAIAKTGNGQVEAIALDIVNETAINTFFEQLDHVDHLVLITMPDRDLPRSPLAEMTTEMAQHAMGKFWSTFFTVRAGVKKMAPDGSITLTASACIVKTSKYGGLSATAAANGAVASFGRLLAMELSPIRVNVVLPGAMEVGVWGDQSEADQAKLAEWAKVGLPMQRLGTAEDLAHAVLGLMTNTYLTGVLLPIDGGLILP